jgi:hypothetical protein
MSLVSRRNLAKSASLSVRCCLVIMTCKGLSRRTGRLGHEQLVQASSDGQKARIWRWSHEPSMQRSGRLLLSCAYRPIQSFSSSD